MDMAAWTRPTDASYERARDYACPTGCTELAKEYIERIWGEGDYTAALLTTSCSDDVACTLPGLYSIPRVEEYKLYFAVYQSVSSAFHPPYARLTWSAQRLATLATGALPRPTPRSCHPCHGQQLVLLGW